MCARSSTRVIAAPTMALPTCSPHWSHTPGRSTAPPCISILRNAPCSSPLLPEPYVELTLIDSYPRHEWLVKAVEKRPREELVKLRVEINEDKSRMVDLAKDGSFSFLGFEYRRMRSRKRVWRPYYAPKLKKRTELFAKLREIFRQNVGQPGGKVIEMINPVLRGWVNYFRVGDSHRCFSMIKYWVEKKIPRPMKASRLSMRCFSTISRRSACAVSSRIRRS